METKIWAMKLQIIRELTVSKNKNDERSDLLRIFSEWKVSINVNIINLIKHIQDINICRWIGGKDQKITYSSL